MKEFRKALIVNSSCATSFPAIFLVAILSFFSLKLEINLAKWNSKNY